MLALLLAAFAPQAPYYWKHPVTKCVYLVIEDNWGKRAAYHSAVCGAKAPPKCPEIIPLKPRKR